MSDALLSLLALAPALVTIAGLRVATRREGPVSTEPVPWWPSDHPYGPYCGGIVWSRSGGGYNGVDGQCGDRYGHAEDCVA